LSRFIEHFGLIGVNLTINRGGFLSVAEHHNKKHATGTIYAPVCLLPSNKCLSPPASLIDNWWAENYTQPSFITIEVDQVDTCKGMVINGLGYGILASRILKDIEELYKIDLTDQKGNPMLRRTWMYYHKESLQWNVVKAFVNFIETLESQCEVP